MTGEHALDAVKDVVMTVRSAVAPMVGEPRIASGLTSQLLAGETVTVLERRGDWLSVRGPDGYEGWTHRGYVSPSDGSESTWRWSMGCRVRLPDASTRVLPFGARFAPNVEMVDGDAVTPASRAARFPRSALAIAGSATSLFDGASYLWGGVTPWGCDCSGFVQRIFGWHGEALPRDAWQQALEGERVSHAADAAHALGDLLFFSDREDRRITHVGMALSGGRMVHSSLTRGGVAIETLSGGDEYAERLRGQCVEVRRYLRAAPA